MNNKKQLSITKIFKSWQDFHHFEQYVKKRNRFFYDSITQAFLQIILETSKSRTETVEKDSILWRSQLGNDWEPYYEGGQLIDHFPGPLGPEKMKPLNNLASEGRANPKGIPYLYLATNDNTAMAEVRPWLGSYISIGQFKLTKDVKLINCTSDDKNSSVYLKEPDAIKREVAVWRDIDRAFSRPITINENTADYVPTQILAEFFKNNGFNGIGYRSSLGKGHNIVLFDLDSADLINCTLHEVKKVSFDFTQTSNTYFISKYLKSK
ncbi:MAG: RES family NAD+ phosphorylase [Thermodesulfovibrionia bacterium]|nr:RES family NAD+ phosphorylase [Thermodesulfovibrionia bacterium]